jgi:hypothetical protein
MATPNITPPPPTAATCRCGVPARRAEALRNGPRGALIASVAVGPLCPGGCCSTSCCSGEVTLAEAQGTARQADAEPVVVRPKHDGCYHGRDVGIMLAWWSCEGFRRCTAELYRDRRSGPLHLTGEFVRVPCPAIEPDGGDGADDRAPVCLPQSHGSGGTLCVPFDQPGCDARFHYRG